MQKQKSEIAILFISHSFASQNNTFQRPCNDATLPPSSVMSYDDIDNRERQEAEFEFITAAYSPEEAWIITTAEAAEAAAAAAESTAEDEQSSSDSAVVMVPLQLNMPSKNEASFQRSSLSGDEPLSYHSNWNVPCFVKETQPRNIPRSPRSARAAASLRPIQTLEIRTTTLAKRKLECVVPPVRKFLAYFAR